MFPDLNPKSVRVSLFYERASIILYYNTRARGGKRLEGSRGNQDDGGRGLPRQRRKDREVAHKEYGQVDDSEGEVEKNGTEKLQ